MSSKTKRKFGDRKDAKLIRDADPLHTFMPYLLLGRTDNEALLNDEIDLSAVLAYLEKKNENSPDFKYTIFHVIIAALAKTIYLRPAMNRFMQGHRLYQRNDISFSFIVKRAFSDKAEEALVIMKMREDSDLSPIEQVYQKVKSEVHKIRTENSQGGTLDVINVLNRVPRPLLRVVAKFLFWLEYHGWLPSALEKVDPYHSTCFISNLGSIKMTASYHHLIDWGTNSFFVIIGEKQLKPLFCADGSYEMREMLPLGFTIDERIADGFYFANSIKYLRYILAHPEILDEPFTKSIDIKGEL